MILVIFPWIEGQQVEVDEMVDRYPDKCFAISTTAWPQYSAHGVYTSVSGLVPKFGGRIRSGGYTTNTSMYKNPFIEGAELGSGAAYPKEYLYSFIGRNCHSVRQALFDMKHQRADVLIEDSSAHFALWDDNRDEVKLVAAQKRFCDVLKQSKFALCPRGISPNSIRLFEALKLGVAPVVLSDGWSFPIGPRWDNFSIVVPERHVKSLEHILAEREGDYQTMGQRAAQAYEQWFSERAYFNFLVDSCLDIKRKQWVPERMAQFTIKTGYRTQEVVASARKQLGIRSRLKKVFGISP